MGTRDLKIDVINKYLRALGETYTVVQYIGLAADEQKRLLRKQQQDSSNKRYPLMQWNWTEKDCIEYCYSRGFDWDGLYDIFSRVSCWCCPFKSLEELRKLREHFPELWDKLRELDEQTWRKFRADYSVLDLEKRFDLENTLTKSGESIKNRAFFADLKRLLGGEVTVDDIIQERKACHEKSIDLETT